MDHIDRYLFDEELVLVGEDGAPFFDATRDVAFRVNEAVWVNNHIHVLRPHSTTDARFLAYCLNTVDFGVYIGGSTRDKLTQDDMREIELPAKDLAEQRRIADFLDDQVARIDNIIAARRREQELLSRLDEAKMAAALWRGDDSLASLRRFGTSVTTGPFGTAFAAGEYVEDGVPMVNPTQIGGGRIIADPRHSIPESVAARLARHRLDAGDLVTGRKGDIGRSALVQPDQDGWICGSDAIAIHCDPVRLSGAYLELVLHQSRVRQELVSKSPGATMPSLNEGMLLSIEIPAIGLQEQLRRSAEAEASRAEGRDAQAAVARLLSLLSELKRSLITAAVTGEFDVSAADGSQVLG